MGKLQQFKEEFDPYKAMVDARGTDDEKDTYFLYASTTSRAAGEFDDQESGVRNSVDHPHHPKDDLEYTIERGKELMKKILQTIQSRAQERT